MKKTISDVRDAIEQARVSSAFKVAALVLGSCYMLVEAANNMLPALGTSEEGLRLVVAGLVLLALIALPASVLGIWVFGGEPEAEGAPRSWRERVSRGQALIALLLIAVSLTGATFLLTQLRRPVDESTVAASSSPTPGTDGGPMTATSADSAAISPKSVAVLPFVNASGTDADEYLSFGVTEELLNALMNVPGAQVAARTSIDALPDSALDARTLARRLGVATFVEGSVQRSGKRLRISAKLINGATGFQMWSQRFDRMVGDIFEMQDEIAHQVVAALELELDRKSVDFGRGTTNARAYDLVLQARWAVRNRDFARAVPIYEQAVFFDPGYAEARTELDAARDSLQNATY